METRFFPSIINIGEVLEVNIEFKKTDSWITSYLYSSALGFDKVTIFNGDEQRRYLYALFSQIIFNMISFFFSSLVLISVQQNQL